MLKVSSNCGSLENCRCTRDDLLAYLLKLSWGSSQMWLHGRGVRRPGCPAAFPTDFHNLERLAAGASLPHLGQQGGHWHSNADESVGVSYEETLRKNRPFQQHTLVSGNLFSQIWQECDVHVVPAAILPPRVYPDEAAPITTFIGFLGKSNNNCRTNKGEIQMVEENH